MKLNRKKGIPTLLGTLLLGSSTALLAADVLKIAIVGPITGPVAQYGDMQMSGAKMAIERINAQGGVNGMQLEAVLMDDVCEPKQAVAVANKVINEDIRFVVGHLCSGSTQPASDIYEDEQVLMITPASTSPAITERGFEMIFRTIGLDSQQGPVAGRYIANSIQPKQLAIIHDKQQYGQGIADEVKQTVESMGVNVVLYEGVTKDQKDFSALITKMKSRNVDFVYYGGYHPELGLILRQSREQGFKGKFMGPEGVGNRDISAIAGEASEGLYVTLPADFTTLPQNRDLVKAFEAKGEDPTGPFVMPAYAAVQIITDSIKATGTLDTVKIANFIRSHSFDTPIGKVQYQPNGDLKDFKFVIYEWHADATKTALQ
ncbi:branched-chain amino acid ABC transporter substrate-binding protein [Ectothiorhodospiraceae bacterium BW-2]|nr:branched-chain amino acid ABC transporter substrate-binding protein [Ectothiorhodospiraceae bacterium BW-2]